MVAFVNQETYEMLPPEVRALLVPLGPVQLKGRDRLVEVYALPRGAVLPTPPVHLLKQSQVEEVL
jgi:class 3 adenylate cyclase